MSELSKPSRRGFLKGLVSFAAAALAMPTALTDSEEEMPEGCACEHGLPCDKGPWFNHYAGAPQFRSSRKMLRDMVRTSGPYLIPFSTRDKGKTTIGPLLAMSKLRRGR
jgi:hypothetical protein